MRRLLIMAGQGIVSVAIAGSIVGMLGATEAGRASQPPAAAESREQRFRRMSADAETRGLAEPFRGVTTNGTVIPDLYRIASTGVSTEPVRAAAVAFLAALTDEQRARTRYALDDPEWRKWMNQHFYVRQGVGFLEMTEAQNAAAIALLKASLSAKGLTLTRDIMKLNTTLAELTNGNFDEYGEGRYWITVMGEPSATEPWGWQLDGHHAIINYFVLGDQVVMTPAFFGSEPVRASAGKYAGVTILQEEQDRGLAFVNTLNETQRAAAVVNTSKTGNGNVGEAFRDNVVLDYAGVRATALDAGQRRALLDLARLYVSNMDDGHATVKMSEVERHLDATWFAWIGATAPESVFYYRIHSPVILIEFDHQVPVGLRQIVKDPKAPFRDHIHVVIRTPNGNDYGKDLLRQHYVAHRHDSSHGHAQ